MSKSIHKMNEQPIQPQSSDEIDIIQFFKLIGRGFSAIGKGIRSFFVFLFNILIFKPFVYFKQYHKIVIPLLVLAFLFGLWADASKKTLYKSEILVSPNYDSGKEIYSHIDMYNGLIGNKQHEKLAAELGVPVDIAKTFVSFEVTPNYNERIDLRSYNDYVHFLDTSLVENLDFNAYRESFVTQKFDYPQLLISVTAIRPDVFKHLNKTFKTLLDNEPLFVNRRKIALKTTDDQINFVKSNIAQLDSLRSAINKAIKSFGHGKTPENSVIVGTSQIKFPETEYDLFEKRQNLVDKLVQLQTNRVDKEKIILMNSSFPDFAPIYNPVWMTYKFSLVISMAVLLIIIFYLIDLIIYLNRRYEQSQLRKEK